MKLKTTYKQIKEGTHPDHLIKVGYCSLQWLLGYKQAFAYSSGYYGWNCDYYEFNVNGKYFVISTGYRPIGKDIDYKIVKKYEDKASKLMGNYDKEVVKNRPQLLDKVIEEFLTEIEG